MKAILISIKPQFVAKILNGEKTIEIRKTCPKQLRGDTPIKPEPIDVYIYCTKDSKQRLYPVALLDKSNQVFKRAYREDKIDNRSNYLNGKVVAKFTLNNVEEILLKPNGNYYTNTLSNNKLLAQSCLSQKEIFEYTNAHISKIGGYWFSGYAIHISDLEIFDRPKELSEFQCVGKKKKCRTCKEHCRYYLNTNTLSGKPNSGCTRYKRLTKAPKSWQFIEVE